MNTPHDSRFHENLRPPGADRRPWSQSEVFCIHSYAGESGPPCGWHGKVSDAPRDHATGARLCPRCGRATLMAITPGL